MGLFNFNLFGGGRGYTSRRGGMDDEYRQALREMRKQKSKLYRTIRTTVVLVATITTALLVLWFFVPDLRHVWLLEAILVVYALCAGGATALPWITEFERDRKKAAKGETIAPWRKIIVYVFWGLIGVAVLLWIISVFVLGDSIMVIVGLSDAATPPNFDVLYAMLRAAIIVTLQVAIGSVVATSIMRYGKKYLVLRIIMYIALAYLDLWLSWFVGGTSVARITGEEYFPPIHSTILWVLAVLMLVGLLASSSIFGARARRKEIELFMKGDVETLTDGDVDLIDADTTSTAWGKKEAPATPSAPAKNPEEQLTKIKELYEKGIITEEEYQAKRKDIIDKM